MTRRILLVMALVFGAGACLAGVLSGGTPGEAANPGPQQLPAVQLIAINACTGTAVTGLTAELSLVTAAGGVNPGPSQNVGLTHKWTTAAVPPGTYDLSLSAAGFSGIGDESTGSSPIQVTKNPGPNGLVAHSGLAETQVVAVSLVPLAFPPNPCLDLHAPAIPQVALQVDDGSTNQVLGDPGPISLQTPSGSEVNPSPTQTPVESFAWGAGTEAAGIYYFFDHGTQGHYLLGAAPDGTVNPLPVTIPAPPDPAAIPPGDGVNYGISVIATLAPDQPQPTVTEVMPKSATSAGGTTVAISGTGLLGTYAVSFGTKTATSFSVNATGTRITAVTPPSTGAGIVQITVTTLGGTATHTFSYT